jgi:tetratricopeptide (TPR) repeat protein
MKTCKLGAFLILVCSAAFASGASEAIAKGNAAFKEGKFDKAQTYYDEAKLSNPESPYIYFNKGTAYFKTEEYDKAKEAFKNVVSKTKDIRLEARANYNLGAVSFAEAGKNTESDLKKAVELYQESIGYYQRALDSDKNLKDAAHNIEVARLVLKDMLDKLKKQEEQNKGKGDKQKEIAEKIAKLIEREETIIDYNTTLSDEKDKKGMSPTLSNSVTKLGGEQAQARNDTGGVIKDIDDLKKSMQQQQPGNPLDKAREHVTNATNYEQLAENQLGARDLKNSKESESGARDELAKALEALSNQDNKNQNKNNEDQKKDEQKEEQKKVQASQAKDILDDEKENKKQRQVQAQAGYNAPDKDW